MKSEPEPEVPVTKVARYDTDFSLCIICQRSGGVLIEKLYSHEKVLKFAHDRARYGDGDFPQMNIYLGDLTASDLISKNATWHRKCYQDTVHTQLTKRAKERFEKQIAARGSRGGSTQSHSSDGGTFTRSQSAPYVKEVCFFCEQGEVYSKPLHKLATENAGRALKEALEKSGNKKLHVKLCTAINPIDAHAIDIRYHKRCWATHVTHVQRRSENPAARCLINYYRKKYQILNFISLNE